MILNLYSWIFPAAVFAAAALSNLTPGIRRKRDPERARRNRVVWFSLNLSISVGILIISVFFINWADVDWNRSYFLFGLIVFLLFYVSFILKFIIGLPVVMLILFSILSINVYLKNWSPADGNSPIGKVRVLSDDQRGIIAEYTAPGSSAETIFLPSSVSRIEFDCLHISRILFFVSSETYCRRVKSNQIPESFPGRIINWLAGAKQFIEKKRYALDISGLDVLRQYDIIFDEDRKLMYAKN